jgi:hypothetical protein
MQGSKRTLRYFLAGRPPRHVVLQLVLALVALVGHVLGDVQRRTGEHVGHREDAGPPRVPPRVDRLGAEQVGVVAAPGDVQVVAGDGHIHGRRPRRRLLQALPGVAEAGVVRERGCRRAGHFRNDTDRLDGDVCRHLKRLVCSGLATYCTPHRKAGEVGCDKKINASFVGEPPPEDLYFISGAFCHSSTKSGSSKSSHHVRNKISPRDASSK